MGTLGFTGNGGVPYGSSSGASLLTANDEDHSGWSFGCFPVGCKMVKITSAGHSCVSL